MDRFEELKEKYASVLDTVRSQGIRLAHLHLQDQRLFLQGAAPNESAKNAVWNQIKAINPACNDISADISIDASLPQTSTAAGRQTYTVQAGDTLSKIAKQFYGNASDYMRIFDANKDRLADPNKINIGQELVIPANR